jgi:hypothetical protein
VWSTYYQSTPSCPYPFRHPLTDAVPTAVPPKVDEAFWTFKYVPYSTIAYAGSNAAAEPEEEYIINSHGNLSAKPLDRRNEKNITIHDWSSAATAAEERTRHYHGNERGDALTAHHQLVRELARMHNWQVAIEYDIQQRYLSAIHLTHDLATLDANAVTLIVSRQLINRASHNTSNTVSPAKRSTTSDLPTPPPSRHKRSRTNHCFRCGSTGHFPADCKAETTASGGTPCFLAGPKAHSKHALLSPNGKVFCFTWARDSSCPFGDNCSNHHGCSICGGSSHGARSCNIRA